MTNTGTLKTCQTCGGDIATDWIGGRWTIGLGDLAVTGCGTCAEKYEAKGIAVSQILTGDQLAVLARFDAAGISAN